MATRFNEFGCIDAPKLSARDRDAITHLTSEEAFQFQTRFYVETSRPLPFGLALLSATLDGESEPARHGNDRLSPRKALRPLSLSYINTGEGKIIN